MYEDKCVLLITYLYFCIVIEVVPPLDKKNYSCSKNISNNSGLHNWSPSKRFAFSFQLIKVGMTLKCVFLSKRNEFFMSFHLMWICAKSWKTALIHQIKYHCIYLHWTIANVNNNKNTVARTIFNAILINEWFSYKQEKKIID